MMYYIVYVFQMAGLTGNTNLTSSSIQYVINFVMTIPAILWVDNVRSFSLHFQLVFANLTFVG